MRLYAGASDRTHYVADFTNCTIDETGKRRPDYRRETGPAPLGAFEDHLAGRKGLLLVPVTPEGTARWGKIDIDAATVGAERYPIDSQVRALAADIHRLRLPLLTERSKSGGAHLAWYAHRELSGLAMREKLAELASNFKFSGKAEFFPTQDRIEEGGFGTGINLPYLGGDTAVNHAIDHTGRALTVEEWLSRAESVMEEKPALGAADVESAAELLVRHWTIGQRDNLNLAVIGALLRAQVEPSDIEQLVSRTQDIGADPQQHKSPESVQRDLDANKHVPGFPRLVEIVGRDDARELMRLMGAVTAPTQTFLLGPAAALATHAELHGLPYAAPQIVEWYLPEDAGGFVSPGGLGKSSIMLVEAVTIRLGRALWGRNVVRPGGATLIVTAEDRRPVVLGRLNEICTAMGLTAEEREHVRVGIYVEDISQHFVRLVSGCWAAGAMVFHPTPLVEELCSRYAGAELAQIVIDPTSLIGPGESFGNDGMGPLMQAGRMISERMHCAVRFLHHTGQAVARQGTHDQYTGRGGTAFADNARFLAQLVTVRDREFAWEELGAKFRVPGEATDGDLAMGRVRAILVHKLSYQPPFREPIFLLRRGWAFTHLQSEAAGAVAADAWMADALVELYDWWVAGGRQPFYMNDVEDMKDTIFQRGRLPKTKAKAVVGFGRYRRALVETGLVKPHAKVSSLTFSADYDPHAV